MEKTAEDKKNNNSLNLILGVVIFLLIAVLIFSFQRSSDNQKNTSPTLQENSFSAPNTSSGDWSLFYYSSKSPNIDYLTGRTDNIESLEACIAAGLANTPEGESYECAFKCEYKEDYQTEICERTCDDGGCRE